MHRSEDGGTVVGDIDVFVLGSCGDRHEDFIHASGTEGGLDEISDCDGANKRRQTGNLSFLFICALLDHLRENVTD